jgi:hypothetical protein
VKRQSAWQTNPPNTPAAPPKVPAGVAAGVVAEARGPLVAVEEPKVVLIAKGVDRDQRARRT